MSTFFFIIAVLLPILVFLLPQFAEIPRQRYKCLFFLIFIDYTVLLFYYAVGNRVSLADYYIQTELFWGYHKPPEYIFEDNIINVLFFIPIGFLASLVIGKYKIIRSLLIGLLISETIECSQLILKRGTFDVDDIFNNTLGAVIGSFVCVIVAKTCILIRKHFL